VEFNIKADYDHKVVWYFEKKVDRTSFVALDDLSVLGHRCQLPIDCDFDNGHICSYSPYQSNFSFGVFTGE